MQDLKSIFEEWRPIKGYEGLYEVSNLGRVRSLDRHFIRHEYRVRVRSKVLSGGVGSHGYRVVNLYRGGKQQTATVHKLVALEFLGNPDNLQVNHKDGNKLNNEVSNLEWVTGSKNMKHAFEAGLVNKPRGEQKPCAKLTGEQVREIRKLKGGLSSRKIAKLFGISKTTVLDIWKKKFWTHID